MRALVYSLALLVPQLAIAQEQSAPVPEPAKHAAQATPAPTPPDQNAAQESAAAPATDAPSSTVETVEKANNSLGIVTAGGMTLAQAVRMDYFPLSLSYGLLGLVIFTGGPSMASVAMASGMEVESVYTPYIVNTKKRSALTGNPSHTIGTGLGQVINIRFAHADYAPFSLATSFEAQTVPVADNDYITLTSNFFKLDVGANVAWGEYLDARLGFSTFTNALAVNNGFFWDQGSQGKLSNQMLAGGFEGAVLVQVPIMGWFTLMLNGEGAYYPALHYPDLDGGTAAFIAMAGYDDLRGADSYYWYRYSAKIRIDPLASYLDFFIGADFSSLVAGNKGSGVNNRGLSLTFV